MAAKKKSDDVESKMTRQAIRSVGGGMANAFEGRTPAKPKKKKEAVLKPEVTDIPKSLKGLRGPRSKG